MSRRLYRSEENKVLAGVCSGIAKYVQVDPLLIRLAFIVLAISQFFLGLVLYAIAAAIMPLEPKQEPGEVEVVDHPHPEAASDSRRTFAFLLIALGVGLMLFRLLPKIPLLAGYLSFVKMSFWPLALIILGILFLMRQGPKN